MLDPNPFSDSRIVFLPEKDGCRRAGGVKEESPQRGITGDLFFLMLMSCDLLLIVPSDHLGMATGFRLRHFKGFS